MGKSRRKINKLRRKILETKIKPRIPTAPPTIVFKSKKDYNRKKDKQKLKKETQND